MKRCVQSARGSDSLKRIKKVKNQDKTEAQMKTLLLELQKIVPRAEGDRTRDITDLVQDVLKYICYLEDEAGMQNVSLLRENPELVKIIADKE